MNMKEIIEKHSRLLEEIDIANSPYSEYNRVWIGTSNGRNVYTFGLVSEDGVKIKRTVVPVYRYKVECQLGRKLDCNEVVHHIDGDMTNDELSNLEVISRADHNRKHIEEGTYPSFKTGLKGTHYYTDGVNNIRLAEGEDVPEGFSPGRTLHK